MSDISPWESIKTPQEDLSVRQVKESKKLPLYWGKDAYGHCVFILELRGDSTDVYNQNVVSVHGIKVDLRVLNTTGNQGLILMLEKHIDQDLFYRLCETLIESLSNVSDPRVGLSVALSQIKRWKAFMAGKRSLILSPGEVRGLFSELIFLKQLFKEVNSEIDALESWQGPEHSHQDFIFSNKAVEVKSLSGRERNTVHISSEDQLEGVNEALFLKVFRLTEMPDSNLSLSLNGLVKSIKDSLVEADAIELYEDKLARAGYVELKVYDKPKFIIAEEKTYRVDNGFPKIVRSKLPSGLLNVRYEIKIENISSYLCSEKDIWSK